MASGVREVFGREGELAVVSSFLDDTASGPAALLLGGEAGVGKTTRWREGVEAAVRLAIAVWALSILLALVGLALMLVYALRHIMTAAAGSIGAITLMFSTVGLLVVRAQPRNRVGCVKAGRKLEHWPLEKSSTRGRC